MSKARSRTPSRASRTRSPRQGAGEPARALGPDDHACGIIRRTAGPKRKRDLGVRRDAAPHRRSSARSSIALLAPMRSSTSRQHSGSACTSNCLPLPNRPRRAARCAPLGGCGLWRGKKTRVHARGVRRPERARAGARPSCGQNGTSDPNRATRGGARRPTTPAASKGSNRRERLGALDALLARGRDPVRGTGSTPKAGSAPHANGRGARRRPARPRTGSGGGVQGHEMPSGVACEDGEGARKDGHGGAGVNVPLGGLRPTSCALARRLLECGNRPMVNTNSSSIVNTDSAAS